MAPSPIPAGYTSVTPYLIVKDAARALDFYQQAFGAVELFRLADSSGKVGHAEMQVGNARFMLADEFPEMDVLGPQTRGGVTASILLYVEDVDTSFQKAVAAGAKIHRPLADQFYGDRSGTVVDPFGQQWTIASNREQVSPAEMQRRYEELMKGNSK